jgi:teichuronic acid biosynthesis glycosyltransferase TuaG
MNFNPLISIITPAFRCEETIFDTYLSIESQGYQNWEWLVTEDCSSDSTFNILIELANRDKRIKLFRNEMNSGAAVSRNNSIDNASGEYIAFIDSDDLWEPNKLELQLAFMKEASASFCFTAYQLVDKQGLLLGKVVDSKQNESLSYEDMLKKKATLGCSTVMLKVSAFDDLKMPLIRTGQDYGLWLKLLKTGELAVPFPQPLTKYRIMPNSISRNKIKKARRQWEIYRDIEGISFFNSIYYFCFYAFRAVFRR